MSNRSARRTSFAGLMGLVLLVSACTGSGESASTASDQVSTPGSAPSSGGTTGAPDTAPATGQTATDPAQPAPAPDVVPTESPVAPLVAVGLLDDTGSCRAGLDLLAANPYVLPTDPAVAGETDRSWVEVYDEFRAEYLPACGRVGEFIDAHPDEPALEPVRDQLAADGRGGWAGYFDDPKGLVLQGDRIGEYCPDQHLVQFDCESALVRIGESSVQLQLLLGLVEVVAAPSAPAVIDVAVAGAEPLEVGAQPAEATVDTPGDPLHGMSVRSPDGAVDLSSFALGTVDPSLTPPIPDTFSALTPQFAVPAGVDGPVEIRLPVPAEVAVDQVRLYALSWAGGESTPLWVEVGPDRAYEDGETGPVVAVQLDGLTGVLFWGVPQPDPAAATTVQGAGWHREAGEPTSDLRPVAARTTTESSAATTTAAPADPPVLTSSDISCTFTPREGKTALWRCTNSRDGLGDVVVGIFGWDEVRPRWTGPDGTQSGLGQVEVVDLVLRTINWAKTHDLGYTKLVQVNVTDIGGLAGQVNPSTPMTARTLNLTPNDTTSTAFMRGTVVHEMFHSVQGDPGTIVDGMGTLLATTNDVGTFGWLIEGLAEWSIDEVLDDENLFAYSGRQIAQAGIDATAVPDYSSTAYPYERGTFFAWLAAACPGFRSDLRSTLTVDLGTDPTALRTLVGRFSTMDCSFGDQLGADRKAGLAAALVYFNYASQLEKNFSLLSPGESPTSVPFRGPTVGFTTWPATVDGWTADTVATLAPIPLPSAGAWSFTVPAIAGTIPEGKEAEVSFSVGAGTSSTPEQLVVSIVGRAPGFTGTSTIGPADRPHEWLSAAVPASGDEPVVTTWTVPGTTVPELFVTVANPDLTAHNAVPVTVSVRIQDAKG